MKPGQIIRQFKSRNGHAVLLRVIAESDLSDLLAYANALIAEDTFLLLSGEPISEDFERTYLTEVLKKVRNDEKIHLVVIVDGKFAGSCEVRRFERRKRHVGEIGISLAGEYRGEGIGQTCIQTLIDEARKTGLRLLTLTCFSINKRAVSLYQKCGFRKAGMIPGMYAYKGTFEEETVMYLPLV